MTRHLTLFAAFLIISTLVISLNPRKREWKK